MMSALSRGAKPRNALADWDKCTSWTGLRERAGWHAGACTMVRQSMLLALASNAADRQLYGCAC